MFIKGSSGVSSHPTLHTYQEGYLLPVLNAEELLFSARHKGLLRQIHDLAELPPDVFDASYGVLMTRFMEFVQVLPHKTNGILGSLLNYGLARAVAVFQKYCQLRKEYATPLLKFAVFSAALLKDVGRVVSNQRIVMTDEHGEFHEDWNPFSGSMVGQCEFYKLYPIAASYLRIELEITPLFARQLIPNDAFLWLSSDLSVFSDWLAALLGEEGVGSKEITWILGILRREDIIAVLTTLDSASVDTSFSDATEYGEAFYTWLKAGIEKGDIAVNSDDASVHVVPEGVLVEKKLFKQFADLAKVPVNFTVIYTQFGNLMGIAKKGGGDYLHAAYFSPGETATTFATFAASTNPAHRRSTGPREGMVVDRDAVFINKAAPDQSALKSTKTIVAVQHHYAAANVIVKTIHPQAK